MTVVVMMWMTFLLMPRILGLISSRPVRAALEGFINTGYATMTLNAMAIRAIDEEMLFLGTEKKTRIILTHENRKTEKFVLFVLFALMLMLFFYES